MFNKNSFLGSSRLTRTPALSGLVPWLKPSLISTNLCDHITEKDAHMRTEVMISFFIGMVVLVVKSFCFVIRCYWFLINTCFAHAFGNHAMGIIFTISV